MGIPKKGSRKIFVDGIEYRWRVRHKSTYSQSDYNLSYVNASVETYDTAKCTLLITFPWARFDAYTGEGEQPITPRLIESCIKTALIRGWKPTEKGQTFTLIYEKE